MSEGTEGRWSLTLYVNGASPQSLEAIETVRALCDNELADQVDLEVIDVNLQLGLVVRDQVLASPTLIKRLPLPLRRLVGDLTDVNRVRTGLNLGPLEGSETPARLPAAR
ncbi:MAG: circadian clock KaiB family protein [Acidimicrobiales bacterium]|jgi:circadian clock protein KaiB